MPAKTVPLSVRVSADEAEFLARLRIDEATTPSEKLRALLRNERRRHEGYRDYRRVLRLTQETLAPALARVQSAENREDKHSEFVHLVADWLPDTIATFLTGMADRERDSTEALTELERRLADRVFRLSESTLRLGVTRAAQALDPGVVSTRMDPLLELVDVIRNNQ